MNKQEILRGQTATLLARVRQYPVVTVTGPRQAGKTTLCRQALPDRPYANLEQPDTREYARRDPRGFLAGFPDGAILDEIQRVPELLSWIQVDVDRRPQPGRYILTGSHQFELTREVGQTLAGRTALLRLLPLSLAELAAAGVQQDVDTALWRGGYPRIHRARCHPPSRWAITSKPTSSATCANSWKSGGSTSSSASCGWPPDGSGNP